MNDNQLGRNIKHLRIIHNETLDELGSFIHCAKSTVKGYENGNRKPDLQTLQLLSVHYNKPVDELLYADLTGLEEISINLHSPAHITELMMEILPLFTSKDAVVNLSFKHGYDLSQKLAKEIAEKSTVETFQLIIGRPIHGSKYRRSPSPIR